MSLLSAYVALKKIERLTDSSSRASILTAFSSW
jgi:hypothetical protein